MSIPKIIHYCWFGGNKKPKLAKKCIRSWKKYCPDYKIIEWNEDNFCIDKCPLYVRQAYEAKKWAFVTDYVRLKIVYENGGIYFDTDVELKKNLDTLLNNKAYFGFENGKYINTGLGFGAEKNLKILLELMNDYESIPFILPDGTFDITSCPVRNTEIFLKHGLKQDDSEQVLPEKIRILPTIYLCPINFETGKYTRSPKTFSVHRFSASWHSEKEKAEQKKRKKLVKKYRRKDRVHLLIHIPNIILMKLIGKERYKQVKEAIKRK